MSSSSLPSSGGASGAQVCVLGFRKSFPNGVVVHRFSRQQVRSQWRLLEVGQSPGKLSTSPVLSRKAHHLEERSPEGHGLQSGTQQSFLHPCAHNRLPGGSVGC